MQRGVTEKTPDVEEMMRQVEHVAGAIGEPIEEEGSIWWTASNAMTISAATLTFGLLFFLLVTSLVIYRVRPSPSADELLRLLATPLIVFFAVFLVVAGYSDKQIAPVMGLLGTIAGYLLAKTQGSKASESATNEGDSADTKVSK